MLSSCHSIKSSFEKEEHQNLIPSSISAEEYMGIEMDSNEHVTVVCGTLISYIHFISAQKNFIYMQIGE